MADMINVATATVEIVPTMKGAQSTITNEMSGAGSAAGAVGGKAIGSSMLDTMGKTMTKLGGSMTKTFTVPIAALGAASVAAWKEVDDGLDTIVEKTGASGAALDDMGNTLKNITSTIPTDFATAGAAIGEVNTRFGLTGQELEDLSSQFIKFAALNNQDVSTSVDNVQKALSAFGMDAEDASGMLDVLNAVGQQTGVSVDTLTNGLIQNATAFQEMGLTADQAAVFMGQMEKSGANSETVMQGLRKALKNAAEDGVDMNTALEDLQNAILNGTDGMDGLTAAYDLFGKSGDQIYGAIQNGTLDFTKLGDAAIDAGGNVSDTFEGTLDPMDQFTTVMNQLKTTGAELVTAVGPALSQILGTVADVVGKVADAWSKLSPETQQFIVKMGLVLAASGPIISAGGKMIGGISTIAGKIKGLTGGLSKLSGGMSTFSSSAGSAGNAAGSAGSSFSSMAGQALLLVAAGVAILLIAAGMWVMANAAIALWKAGPGAIATFVGIAAVAVGMVAAILALGSAATVSAAGLLALGAAVLMISIGMAILVLAVAEFCKQLPVIAEYGLQAALNITLLGAALAIMAVACAVLAVTLVALTLALVVAAVTLAVAALAGTAFFGCMLLVLVGATMAMIGILLLEVALLAVAITMSDIAKKAQKAGSSLASMASSVNVISSSMAAIGSKVSGFVQGFINALTGQTGNATSAGKAFGTAAVTGMTSAVPQATSAGRAIASGFQSGINSLPNSISSVMNRAQSTLASGLSRLQNLAANTRLRLNQHMPLPHFYMNGDFDAKSKRVPTVGVQWYRSAATEGALFSSPTIIGVGDASQPELLIGQETLKKMIGNGRNITMNVYGAQGQDVRQLADYVVDRLQAQINREVAVYG